VPQVAPKKSGALQTLAANLKALRAKSNWSTRALAQHARIARATLQRIEALEFETVTIDTVDRLARGLGVRTGSLFGRRPLARRDGDQLVEDALAENLATLREVRHLTQDALGARSGVSMYVIAHIERKARSPDLATLERLAKALRVSVARLLTEPSSAAEPRAAKEPRQRAADSSS
jgi:transcriptional regulator with XRE-family HTH domain